MKHGDLVSVRERYWRPGCKRASLCVALNVTADDIRAGVQVDRPGLYLFRGYWYGNSPLSHRSYGKIEGQRGKVVGHMRSHQQAKALHI